MTLNEFRDLDIGDKCTIIRGHDVGRICEVVYIEHESVVVRASNGLRFFPGNKCDILRVTSYRELKLI